MRRVTVFLATSLVVGLLPLGTATAVNASTSSEWPQQDMRVDSASGTASDILASVATVPPLRVGYKPGLFPSLASKAKDKRGCTLRNQMLIKLAVKKPRVLKGCRLQGGEWVLDFGAKVVTKASQIKLAKLVPDVYVYGQGASQWTQEQRDAYTQVPTPVRVTPTSKTRSLPMPISNYDTIFSVATSLGLFTPPAENFMLEANKLLASEAAPTESQLQVLKSRNPGLFDDWSLATLLNAKAWGLSLSPSLHANFQASLLRCPNALKSLPMPSYSQSSVAYNINPCSDGLAVTEMSKTYRIAVVPQTATTVPALDPEILYEYGTPTGDVITRQMFGIHAPADWTSNLATGYDGPIDGATIPNVPVGFLRLWDTETTWKDLEPKQGEFVWRKLDKQVEMAQHLDANVMLVLGQTPAWAGNGSPQSNPTNIDSWRNYVRTVCQHYGGSISAYEVWNEANLQTFWTGTAAQMADLTKAAFEEIRGCNPGAQVVAANTTSRATGSFGTFFPDYLRELKARNWPVDAYSVHSYPTASGGANARIEGIGQFRAALALAGAPVTRTYDTEINYGLEGLGEGHVTLTGDNSMTLMSRTYIDSARYGFGSTFWFVWTKAPDSKFGIQFTAQASAERQAWNTTYEWLVGSRFQRCINASTDITVCQFTKGAENYSIVWHGDVGSAPVSTSAGYFTGLGSRVCDLKGTCTAMTKASTIPVGPMPLRIDGTPLSTGPGANAPDPTPAPGSSGYDVTLPKPEIHSIDVVYGVSNKVDATATWSMASTSDKPLPSNTFYQYSWSFCQGQKCTEVASGTTAPNTFRVTSALTEGPGTYTFTVRALAQVAEVGNPMSEPATKNFQVFTTRAAPPSDPIWWLSNERFEARWEAPNIKPGLIKGYQVEFRNVTKDSDWSVLDRAWESTSLSAKASRIPISEGETGIIRVRTVLKDGKTSVYIPSETWVYRERLDPPAAVIQWDTPSGIGLHGIPGGGVLGNYPKEGFEVRCSTDAGKTWTFLKADSIDGKIPADPNRFAFSSSNTLKPCGETYLLQFRTVTSDGRAPSEWFMPN